MEGWSIDVQLCGRKRLTEKEREREGKETKLYVLIYRQVNAYLITTPLSFSHVIFYLQIFKARVG